MIAEVTIRRVIRRHLRFEGIECGARLVTVIFKIIKSCLVINNACKETRDKISKEFRKTMY